MHHFESEIYFFASMYGHVPYEALAMSENAHSPEDAQPSAQPENKRHNPLPLLTTIAFVLSMLSLGLAVNSASSKTQPQLVTPQLQADEWGAISLRTENQPDGRFSVARLP